MSATPTASTSRGLHITLWVLQVLVGVGFLFIGGMKFGSLEEMAKQGATWALKMPWLPRFIGVSEVAGGLGLILPAATRIKPILTPIAAAALCVVMVLAAGYHVMANDVAHIAPALVFLALCAFIAWGRFTRAAIAPK